MISIITPVLNERDNIEPFFKNLNNLKGDFELILVDGGSTDGTLEEIDRVKGGFHHTINVLGAPKGRASQMNKGSEVAKGDILLFLHVDSQIEVDSLKVIENELREKGIIGGGFIQSFTDPDLFLKLTSAFGNARSRMTGIFFGDFGIFIRKNVFEDMGGYDNIPILEDVEFCKKAKRYGRLMQIDRIIQTSPRRYEKIGKLRLTAVFTLAVILNMAGLRPKFLYKYIVEM